MIKMVKVERHANGEATVTITGKLDVWNHLEQDKPYDGPVYPDGAYEKGKLYVWTDVRAALEVARFCGSYVGGMAIAMGQPFVDGALKQLYSNYVSIVAAMQKQGGN